MIVGVKLPCELKLFKTVEARDRLRLCFGFAQCRQEEAREDRDDGDDDEQLDQCKPLHCASLDGSLATGADHWQNVRPELTADKSRFHVAVSCFDSLFFEN